MKPTPVVLATLALDEHRQALVREALAGAAELVCLADVAPHQRMEMLARADALLCRHTGRELQPGEAAAVRQARVIQFINAGLDFVPLHEFPPEIPIASNRGAWAAPIAEHTMAMCLAASKRLVAQHLALSCGEFNQFAMNRELAGAVCGILGLGGIGSAVARLAKAFGMQVFGVNRRGASETPVDRLGTLDDLDDLLRESDVLVVSLPLTAQTDGLLGRAQLALMKRDATLVNVARGEIVDQSALYERLVDCPGFTACIEAWWVEPTRHGSFKVERPFFDLPNFIGSPHNSASVPSAFDTALQRAVENVRGVLQGEPARNLVSIEERAGRT